MVTATMLPSAERSGASAGRTTLKKPAASAESWASITAGSTLLRCTIGTCGPTAWTSVCMQAVVLQHLRDHLLAGDRVPGVQLVRADPPAVGGELVGECPRGGLVRAPGEGDVTAPPRQQTYDGPADPPAAPGHERGAGQLVEVVHAFRLGASGAGRAYAEPTRTRRARTALDSRR